MSSSKAPKAPERHPLQEVQRQLDESHPGLGRAVCFALVCAVAKRSLLVIAPRGTGKSTVSNLINELMPDSKMMRQITGAGLHQVQDTLTSYRGCIIIDDLGAMNTDYMRSRTITTLAELTYTGKIEEHTGHQNLVIDDFRGSCIVNCQPIVYKKLLNMPEWEATAEDKTVRYYHLWRPTKPNLRKAVTEIDTTMEIHHVETVDMALPGIKVLLRAGGSQWGPSRAEEHITAMLKAMAALRLSKTVNELDVWLLRQLIRPCWLERKLVEKADLDGDRTMDSNLLYIMTEYLSFGSMTLSRLMRHYGVSESGGRRVIERYHKTWVITTKTPETTYTPNDEMEKLLSSIR